MDREIKNVLGLSIIVSVILAVVASFWYVSSFSRSLAPTRTFSVSGEGKVVAVPDVAELSLGVLTEGGNDLAKLQEENSEKVNRVIAFLKERGVDKKDIQTQFYNITPRYQYFSCPPALQREAVPCPPSEIMGYTINQNVLVKARDLNKVGNIIAGVVQNGANTVSGPTFTVDDSSELQNKARTEAITKARKKAKSIARAGDFRLGKLISISEGDVYPRIYSYAESAKGVGGGGDFNPPAIEPGSQEIKVNVILIYEIR